MFKKRVRYNAAAQTKRPIRKRRFTKVIIVGVLLVLIGGGAVYANSKSGKPAGKPLKVASITTHATTTSTASLKAAAPSPCATNTLSKVVLVSISARHMWACSNATQDYDSAVITGMENLAADLTPTGTYHIYGKQTDLTLSGSDSTGSWNDPVSYWMPFLDNQYGAYGFHDATWRPADAFGNVSPYSSDASHGCVELPLATAAWLYGWAPIGTTVTIES